MSNLWLDTFLGNTGKYVIQFIDKYYFYFVPVIILYGIFMAISSYNLKRLERRTSTEVVKKALFLLKTRPRINYTDLLAEIEIDWEDMIKKYSFFPFISMEPGLWVKRTNIFNVRESIIHNEKKKHLILERSGILLLKNRRLISRNLYLEAFHRIKKS